MESFSLKQAQVTGGFFKEKQDINENITMQNVYARFAETGRFDALKCKKQDIIANIFWDSDAAKWMEAAAYVLYKKEDKDLRSKLNEAIEDIIANQRPDGYFNSHFQVYDPQSIFMRRTDHELYCAGHFFEAAVACAEYLGDNRLLEFSEKFCRYIYERFVTKKDTGFSTPGHPEIELALYRLYKLTGKKLYKDLMEFFLNERGVREEQAYDFANQAYSQSHAPIRQQHTAEGHSVRALYLYTAMADLAKENGDSELATCCRNIYDDIVTKKMYVTGGVGSSPNGETFTFAYDLPNSTAYAETCAAISLALFADRLMKIDGKAEYGDLLERVIYNAVLAGVSKNGKAFFYVNPLQMNTARLDYNDSVKWRDNLPIAKRLEVFDCSCCPPNICRFLELIPSYIYYQNENEIIISQYITSSLKSETADIQINSGFPYNGKVSVTINSHGKKLTLKLRKPLWCNNYTTDFKSASKDGYLIIEKVFCGETIDLDFEMTLKEIYSNSAVTENAGRKALSYGPLILCAEGADNDFDLNAVKISPSNYKITNNKNIFTIQINAKLIERATTLYSCSPPAESDITLKLIPYFEWANRGKNDMQIWFL